MPAFVRMLAGGMAREPSVSMLQILHSVTGQLMTLAGDPAWVPEGKSRARGGRGPAAARGRAGQ